MVGVKCTEWCPCGPHLGSYYTWQGRGLGLGLPLQAHLHSCLPAQPSVSRRPSTAEHSGLWYTVMAVIQALP